VSFGGVAPKGWEALMNVAMGVGGTLTVLAGVFFFAAIGLTLLGGRKLLAPHLGKDLATLDLRPVRQFVYTPTALIPGVIFVVVVLMLTAGAFGIMAKWPIQFG
jgi:hypothetical protein